MLCYGHGEGAPGTRFFCFWRTMGKMMIVKCDKYCRSIKLKEKKLSVPHQKEKPFWLQHRIAFYFEETNSIVTKHLNCATTYFFDKFLINSFRIRKKLLTMYMCNRIKIMLKLNSTYIKQNDRRVYKLLMRKISIVKPGKFK